MILNLVTRYVVDQTGQILCFACAVNKAIQEKITITVETDEKDDQDMRTWICENEFCHKLL